MVAKYGGLLWSRVRYNKLPWAVVAVLSFALFFEHHQSSVRQTAMGELCSARVNVPFPGGESAHSALSKFSPAGSRSPMDVDQFADPDPFLTFKRSEECMVTRPGIHRSFTPKCKTKADFLHAASSGGRLGQDQPYSFLGCDMKWYTTTEICDILSHFDYIEMIGDSLARQLSVAMHILLREDVIEGGRATWQKADGPEEEIKEDGTVVPAVNCRCRNLFKKGSNCMWFEAINTAQIWTDDPTTMKCGRGSGMLNMQQLPTADYLNTGLDDWVKSVADRQTDPRQARNAYLLSAGAWQAYNSTMTMEWLDRVDKALEEKVPLYRESPKLWMSPPARGANTAALYWHVSNNIAVQQHIWEMEDYVKSKGFDHLRTYNLTVQATSPDGLHASLENALVESMMLLNWLDKVREY